MARRTSGPVARGPVPRDRSHEKISSGPTDLEETVVWDRLIPNGRMGRRNLSGPVARGPVPRDRTICAKNHPPAKAVSRSDRGTARDRPSPYGPRHVFSPRSADPRENRPRPRPFSVQTEARRGTGPRPTVSGKFFYRNRPTRAKNARRPKPFPVPHRRDGF